MRYLLSFLIFISAAANADADHTLPELETFSSIQTNKNTLNGEVFAIKGFLLKDAGEFYFCATMDACYSYSKERLILIPGDTEMSEILHEVDECHMTIYGEFRAVDTQRESAYQIIGYLNIQDYPTFSFSAKYDRINNHCKVFNIRKAAENQP